jgi:hypothetical protein
VGPAHGRRQRSTVGHDLAASSRQPAGPCGIRPTERPRCGPQIRGRLLTASRDRPRLPAKRRVAPHGFGLSGNSPDIWPPLHRFPDIRVPLRALVFAHLPHSHLKPEKRRDQQCASYFLSEHWSLSLSPAVPAQRTRSPDRMPPGPPSLVRASRATAVAGTTTTTPTTRLTPRRRRNMQRQAEFVVVASAARRSRSALSLDPANYPLRSAQGPVLRGSCAGVIP